MQKQRQVDLWKLLQSKVVVLAFYACYLSDQSPLTYNNQLIKQSDSFGERPVIAGNLRELGK